MNILIITSAKLPEGDAESIRLHSLGMLFRDLGHNVAFVGMGNSEYLKEFIYSEFTYVSLRKTCTRRLEKLYYYLNYNSRLKVYLHSYFDTNNLDAILFSDLTPISIRTLIRISKKWNLQLITDSVEWYSPEQFRLGLLSPQMILKNIENKYTINKKIKVIAISNYLYDHFKNRGCTCIRIPTIFDVSDMPCTKVIDINKTRVLYAGSPGKKDYVREMLKGVLLLNDDEMDKVIFEFAGVKINDILNEFTQDEITKLKRCVIFLGRVNRNTVLERLSYANFTALLRSPTQRYAKAGFPTKVVESLSTATPAILNITSDLSLYMNNMNNCIIVNGCTGYEFSIALRKAINMKITTKQVMSSNARKSASDNFDYRIYSKLMKRFLEES